MTTSPLLRWALALALMFVISSQAGEAFARAGSGGSRGSRSYSTPARPSPASPVTPSSPSRPYTTPTPTPASQPSRGWFGPIMGGLAGFALGGLLGSMLFGGGFGGGFGSGIGLFDILLIGGALYLLYRFMTARRAEQPRPAYATAGGYGYAGDVATEPPAVADVPSDLDRGLAHIRQMDASFDPRTVADPARRLFAEVQAGITARDMSAVSAKLTSRMYTELSGQCDRLRAARRTNRVEQIEIGRAEASEAWQESGQDYVTVYLAGSLVDYTVDDTSGAVVDGNRVPQDFEEYWTFVRPVGPNAWKLSAIQTA
jgi:predicted lipid-binding transport protein (Tim44 family)